MWQAIAANRRRSRLIIFVMGAVLIALGASLGTLIGPALVDLGYAPPGEETWAGALAGGREFSLSHVASHSALAANRRRSPAGWRR